MPDDDTRDDTGDTFDTQWAAATMLGEAVWHRAASRRGLDPKAEAHRRAHDDVVSTVRDAAFVLERDGWEGLAEYLDLESRLTPTPSVEQVFDQDEGDQDDEDALGVMRTKGASSRPASDVRNRRESTPDAQDRAPGASGSPQ